METSFTAPPDRVSPSLLRPLPAWVARASPACVTPTGQIRLVHPVEPVQVPVGHAACPASPSLKRKTPEESSDTSPVDDAGPTLVGLPGDRATAAAEDALVQANCKRASRMARPAMPSEAVLEEMQAVVKAREEALLEQGLALRRGDGLTRYKTASASVGKGPAVRAGDGNDEKLQKDLNHLVSLKRVSIHSVQAGSRWPPWLNGPNTLTPQMFARLLALAFQSNTVNSSVTQPHRAKTEQATNQTSRINVKGVSQAAAAQMVAVAAAQARALQLLRDDGPHNGIALANPMATNARDAPCLWSTRPEQDPDEKLFALTMTSKLVFNAMPHKLGGGSILAAAQRLAKRELDDCAISEVISTSSHRLEGLCRAIASPNEFNIDPAWASFVLVVFLSCHPGGRALLRTTPLADSDYQTATALEEYGRGEVTGRARREQKATQPKAPSARGKRSKTPVTEAPDDGAAPAERADVSVSLLHAHEVSSEKKKIAQKQKRGVKGCTSSNSSDSSEKLVWWYEALRSEFKPVLLSLVAHSRRTVQEAAHATLEAQAGPSSSVAQSTILRQMSTENATQSAMEIGRAFVSRKPTEAPAVLVWQWQKKVFMGLSRTVDEARTTRIHAAHYAPMVAQPDVRREMAIVWTTASLQLAPQRDETLALPGLLERLATAYDISAQGGKRAEAYGSRLGVQALSNAEAARSTAVSGVTRATLSFRMQLRMHASQDEAGALLADEMREEYARAGDTPAGDAGIPKLCSKTHGSDASRPTEPLCTPASRLGLGLAINEELSVWMLGKSRKNDPHKVTLGVSTAAERNKEVNNILDSRPFPLLTIVDVQLSLAPTPCAPVYHADRTRLADANVALHVCGDAPVGLPEALLLLRYHPLGKDEPREDEARARAHRCMAFVMVASSQSSFIGNVGPTISAGFLNAAISSSRKIAVPDLTRLMFLSAFDVYLAGLVNVEPSFLGTAYAGTYGCGLDTGISSPGNKGDNLRSDKRQHGARPPPAPPGSRPLPRVHAARRRQHVAVAAHGRPPRPGVCAPPPRHQGRHLCRGARGVPRRAARHGSWRARVFARVHAGH